MPGLGRPNILTGEQGNFTLLLALSLTLILTLIFSVLDLGFFVREKNRYQAAAEAAALAAVDTICYSTAEDLEIMIMDIIEKFNLDIQEDAVDIELGFYDAYNEYEAPLGRYQDFASTAEGSLPDGQPTNAVMITIGFDTAVKSLTGFIEKKEIVGAAVAYIPKISMSSGGDIDFQVGSKMSMHNGSIYAAKDIKLRGDDLARSENNIRITTSENGTIEKFINLTPSRPRPWWKKSGTMPSEFLPERSLVNNHMISISDLVSRLKKKADKTLTPVNRGDEFYEYREIPPMNGKPRFMCFFDFTRSHDAHQIIYIDLPDTCTAYLTPYPCGFPGNGDPPESCTPCNRPQWGNCSIRSSFGSSMSNLTVLATCNVVIPIYKNNTGSVITLGGGEFDRINIISLGSIEFSTRNNELAGVNFVCKNSFKMSFKNQNNYIPPLKNCIRVISESGDIEFSSGLGGVGKHYAFELSSGLQCPPLFPSVLGSFVNAE